MTRSEDAVDSPLGASTRFGVELLAWIAAPWAAVGWSPLAAALLLAVLVFLPARFNVPGDKNITGHPVSGPTRIGIELLLYACAMVGAILAWPTWAAGLVVAFTLAAAIIGLPRWRWLLRQPRPGACN